MRKLLLVFLIFCMGTVCARAQNERSWEEWLGTMSDVDDAESDRLELTYEELSELENHKIDLNRCTRDELLQLPFLSAQQVMDFIEYRDRHGRIETMVELYTGCAILLPRDNTLNWAWWRRRTLVNRSLQGKIRRVMTIIRSI